MQEYINNLSLSSAKSNSSNRETSINNADAEKLAQQENLDNFQLQDQYVHDSKLDELPDIIIEEGISFESLLDSMPSVADPFGGGEDCDMGKLLDTTTLNEFEAQKKDLELMEMIALIDFESSNARST